MAGAFEADRADPVAPSTPKLFREAMSRLGAAVHVVTTDGPRGKTGFTATAVCSVSDHRPTLLVCLNRSSGSGALVRNNGVLCVNTLRAAEANIADVFAGRTGVQAARTLPDRRLDDAEDRRAGAAIGGRVRSTAGSSR